MKCTNVMATVSLLFASTLLPVQAKALDWRYVEGGFVFYDLDGRPSHSGLQAASKYLLSNDIFVNAELGYVDSGNLTYQTIGAGYRMPIDKITTAYVGANVERVNYDNFDDTGYSLVGGVRIGLLENLELTGELSYYNLDDGDINLKAAAIYAINPQLSLTTSYKIMDSANILQIGARYSF